MLVLGMINLLVQGQRFHEQIAGYDIGLRIQDLHLRAVFDIT